MRSHALLVLTTALLAIGPQPKRAGSSNPCQPAMLAGYCRVGCPDRPPVLRTRVEPRTEHLTLPLPRRAAIIEAGVDLTGSVVSTCVLKGVRADVDRAAQDAVRQWRFDVPTARRTESGFVLAVTVCPGGDCG